MMTGIALKGTDLILSIDSSLVASAIDWSVSTTREMLEISTLGSGKGKTYTPDRSDYTVSVNGLVFKGEGKTQVGYLKLLDKMQNTDASIAWSGALNDSSAFLSGWGFINSAPVQVAQGSVVSYSIEIQGCGLITINTAL